MIVDRLGGKVAVLKENKRNPYWQEIRGICLLAVIMMHCPSGATYDGNAGVFIPYLFLRQFINFPVAIFIFLSGFFSVKENMAPTKYYINRCKKLIIPFVIWSIIYYVIAVYEAITLGEHISWIRMAVYFIWGQAAPPFYYIIALLQLTFLTPYLINAAKKKSKAIALLMGSITPAYLLILYLYKIYLGSKGIPFSTLYAAVFPAWFGFYWLGIYIRCNEKQCFSLISKWGKVGYLTIAFFLSVIESVLWIQANLGVKFALNQVRYTCFLFATIFIFILVKNQSLSIKRGGGHCFLKYIGDISYGIFYVHILFIRLVEKILSGTQIANDFWIYWIFTFIGTLELSILFVASVKLIFRKKQKILSLLGM